MDLVDQIAMDITEPPLLIEDMHVAPPKKSDILLYSHCERDRINLISSYVMVKWVEGMIIQI